MDAVVGQLELITRYLRNGSDMRRGGGRPKYTAYLPREENGEISVYRTDGTSAEEIRAIGFNFVERPESPLKGYCNLVASAFFAEGLNIVSDPVRHPRHANVVGWAVDPKNRIIAKKLADEAELVEY